MKKLLVILLLTGLIRPTYAETGTPDSILPAPAQVSVENGSTPWRSPEIRIGTKAFRKATAALPDFAREEAYRLTVSRKGIRIEANTDAGVFYARQSLAQMSRGCDSLQCCTIFDYPRFAWRGILLDISRHFRDKAFILKQIDAMAEVRLNRLHLHLTDDAGWRIEIKAYPRLTEYTAWRQGFSWKEWVQGGKQYCLKEDAGACGGYLTQEDAREIVAYAAARHITVIPEIEMPGHSAEVLAAFPELSCLTADGGKAANRSDLCPGNEKTYEFLENVLREIFDLFPSPYIHVGGDEAGKRNWPDCPLCRARMEAEGLHLPEELQSYLIARIERFLNQNGRQLLGWDEILEGGLAPNATVMSWRGTEGGIQAASMGHDVVMTPGAWCYLDKYQDAQFKEPEAIGGYLPLEKVYSYDPLDGIPEDAQHHVLGVQGNLWHEYIPTPEHTEYMLWPRALAIAENGWTLPERKDWASFRARAEHHSDYLAGKGYHPFDLRNEFGERKASLAPIRHLAVGKPVSYALPWHKSYPAAGATALTDGLAGSWSYGDGRWQGFLSDVDVTIDLGSVQDIHYVGATFMMQPGPEIFLPVKVEIFVSDDGVRFDKAGEVWNEVPHTDKSVLYPLFGTSVNARGRYIRYYAQKSYAWLFLDEIVVN
ncbi:MAG: family 20 glycosylhydrolase [Bacteroidales bacterium]|nr:family 20 glycosylhydrolase [Bacteroidales bacterium]